ncbi:hypothetical protein ACOYW6_07560 [Parablastomonas sp. CN1-191]|uniref:hypothetical protein n=1 Tax=Parablastomonas sp. CN1-191 TaxID=3400908 RepID=UPI003BF896F4
MTPRTILAVLALAAAPTLVGAQAPVAPPATPAAVPALKPDQQAALHCSAVFARIAHERAAGGAAAAALPDLGTRGREYFVRISARIIDDTGAGRPQISALFAGALADVDRTLMNARDPAPVLNAALAPCRTLLDLEVPQGRPETSPAG